MTDKPIRDDVLRSAGDPSYWMTQESKWRLSNGGNCKGVVPVHAKRSSTAIVPLYTEAQLLAMYAAGAAAEREVSDKLATALQRIAKLRIVEADEIIDDYVDLITKVVSIRATHTNREQAD